MKRRQDCAEGDNLRRKRLKKGDMELKALFNNIIRSDADFLPFIPSKCSNLLLRNEDFETTLEASAEMGFFQTTTKILNNVLHHNYSAISSNPHAINAFLISAESGNIEFFENMLSLGLNINSQNEEGNNALHFAINSSLFDFVQYLVEKKLINIHQANHFGITPFLLAIKKGNLEMAKYLEKKGSNVKCVALDDSSAFHLAAENGHLHCLKYLKEIFYPDPHVKDENEEIMEEDEISFSNCPEGENEVIIDNEFEFTFDEPIKPLYWNLNISNQFGLTPFLLASKFGHIKCVEYFVDQIKCSVNATCSDGMEDSVLIFASQNGHLGCVKYLVEKGATVNYVNKNNLAALHLAVENGHIDVVKYLCKKGSDLEAHTKSKLYPILLSIKFMQNECARYFIDKLYDRATRIARLQLYQFSSRKKNKQVQEYLKIRSFDILKEYQKEQNASEWKSYFFNTINGKPACAAVDWMEEFSVHYSVTKRVRTQGTGLFEVYSPFP